MWKTSGLKKIEPLSLRERRELIEPEDSRFSLRRQCEILGLPRSSWYYQPVPVSEWEIYLMHLIDEQFTLTPFYGVPKMTETLKRLSEVVGERRVRRLMRQMCKRRSKSVPVRRGMRRLKSVPLL